MDDPSLYMFDGSYSNVTVPTFNRKITYSVGASVKHSGIITSITGGIVNVTSKWGCTGLLRHEETSCPYYVSPTFATLIMYWKAN